MALFIVAKNTEETEEIEQNSIYRKPRDLRNLLFYCYNHCTASTMNNLYALGTECVYYQFLYHQKRRVKPLHTHALHYILTFDSQNYEADIDSSTIVSIMNMLNYSCFTEYQNICFLHEDKPSHKHVHWIINPVNLMNLSVYRINFWTLMYQVAEILGVYYNIALQPVTYQNAKGEIVCGKESGAMVYTKKFLQNYNLEHTAEYIQI